VKSNIEPSPRGFRRSPRLRRFGSVALGAFVVGYLVVITASWVGAPISPRRLGLLVTLWVLGLVAVGLLVRGYRQADRGRNDIL
jgi:hypothetical protein